MDVLAMVSREWSFMFACGYLPELGKTSEN